MITENGLLVFLLLIIFVYLIGFTIGYILGRMLIIGVNSNYIKENNNKNIQKTYLSQPIDEKIIVTDVNTSGLEKKFTELGETKTTQENISDSINKLKNIKR